MIDLIAAALLSTGEGTPRSVRLTLTRVKFWIETHLAERLSGEEIANHCGLSLRQLNRLFEGEGTSLKRTKSRNSGLRRKVAERIRAA
jgi:transcriptional regulator GlxA family with amidase domain